MIRQRFWSAIVVVAACSSSKTPSASTTGTSSTTSGGPAMTLEQACNNYSTRLCELYARCDPWNLEAIHGTVDSCKARHQLTCPYRFAAEGSSLTIAALEACSASLTTFSCDTYNHRFELPPECQIQPGKLPDGAACGLDEQCQGAVCKKATGRSACGVCQERVGIGGTCLFSSECAADLWCPLGTCQPFVEEGGPCDNDQRTCRGYLQCIGIDTSDAGTGSCQKPLDTGAACDALDSRCDFTIGLTCVGGPTCHPAPFANPGQMCGAVGSNLVICRARATCDTGNISNTGTCIPPGADGAPCVSSTDCLALTRCINQICTIPDPATCR